MASIPNHFNFGDTDNMELEELVTKLQRMYMDIAEAVNSKPDLYQRDIDGQTTDTFLAQGSINLNIITNKVEMLTEHVDPSTVVWTQLS